MKKVINGSLYDTDTAKPLGEWYTDLGMLTYVCETLYRTKSGKYFVHGEGGPASRYAAQTGTNSWKSGAKITPVSLDGAQKWAEDNLTGEEYLAAFGPLQERTVVSVLPRTRKKLEALKKSTGMTYSDIIDAAVAQYAESKQ